MDIQQSALPPSSGDVIQGRPRTPELPRWVRIPVAFTLWTVRIVLGAWIGGFFVFWTHVSLLSTPSQPTTPLEKAQAIIVLTGEKGRIAGGIRLWQQGWAPIIYISGYPHVQEPLPKIKHQPSFLTSRFFLQDAASNTWENFLFTGQWLRDHAIISVHLVTSDYHIPRSLLIAKKLWPSQIKIYIHPLRFPCALKRRLVLLGREYIKFLWTLSGFKPYRTPRPALRRPTHFPTSVGS